MESGAILTESPLDAAQSLVFPARPLALSTRKQLDLDKVGNLAAQRDAAGPDLAEHRCHAGNPLDDRRLAQAEFPQPAAQIRLTAQASDSGADAGGQIRKTERRRVLHDGVNCVAA